MAIRLEFYKLIVPIQTGKLYYPEFMGLTWCWNDGVICAPGCAMNTHDAISIIKDCENIGLSGLTEIDGERKIVDFCMVNQFGDPLLVKCDWLRVHNGVAWNPNFPFGIHQPDDFPCEYGGFYYESQEVWEQSKLALSAFNEVLGEYEQKQLTHENNKLSSDGLFDFMPLMPQKTAYDNFFVDLALRTFDQDYRSLFEKAPG